MKLLIILLSIGAAASALAAVLVYSGAYNIAADEPHSVFVYNLMEAVRDRSIAARVSHIEVPPLDDSQLVAKGAKDYADMCIDCHLKPGVTASEIREGLYPKPPNLTEHIEASPAEMFWVIKHGIKMSAMPAWGKTHDDERIWAMVAFLQKLPELAPDQYQALVSASGEAHHHHHDHDHDVTGTPRAKDNGHKHQHGDSGLHNKGLPK